ncbi:hypothetical protein U3516DRAFT_746832 [Neocallimastix sp. 'constans']
MVNVIRINNVFVNIAIVTFQMIIMDQNVKKDFGLCNKYNYCDKSSNQDMVYAIKNIINLIKSYLLYKK